MKRFLFFEIPGVGREGGKVGGWVMIKEAGMYLDTSVGTVG